jgi:hypothetical protein
MDIFTNRYCFSYLCWRSSNICFRSIEKKNWICSICYFISHFSWSSIEFFRDLDLLFFPNNFPKFIMNYLYHLKKKERRKTSISLFKVHDNHDLYVFNQMSLVFDVNPSVKLLYGSKRLSKIFINQNRKNWQNFYFSIKGKIRGFKKFLIWI